MQVNSERVVVIIRVGVAGGEKIQPGHEKLILGPEKLVPVIEKFKLGNKKFVPGDEK
jgi:hypothetical protein